MWASKFKKHDRPYALFSAAKKGGKMLFTVETHISLVLHKGKYNYLKVNFCEEKKSKIRNAYLLTVDERKLLKITFNSVWWSWISSELKKITEMHQR